MTTTNSAGTQFQSTSLVRGTTSLQFLDCRLGGISIHVPRERDDLQGLREKIATMAISIHVPRERDDSKNVAFCNKLTKAICANRSKEEL